MSHDGTPTNIFTDIFHIFFSVLDKIIFTVIQGVYNVFFSVSTSTILDGSIVRVLYQRVQLILGVFMIFKLALSILNLIINPDMLKDKNSGTGKIVMRVVVCLMLLTVVVPLNIPNAQPRTLNGYINDHGILFGMLYAVQDRILRENIIAKLVLGYATTEVSGDDEAPDATMNGTLDNAGNMLATTILKSFVVVNVKDDTLDDICGGDDATCPNVYCVREVQESGYLDSGATVGTIMDTVNLKCDSDGSKYAFRYMIPFSTIVGIILIFVLVGYTIDVAIRAFKLMFLRIIAPIPIISYVDPKSSKDGAFASWVKTLTSTYIDLFLRLAIIYFVIFVIAVISQQGLSSIAIGTGGLFTRSLTYVFIVIGLLFFARQAPSFIRTMLGAKGVGFGPGVSGVLGATGALAGRSGVAGALAAGITTANATNEAHAQGKQAPGAFSTGRDMALKIRTGDDKAQGGLLNNFQRTATRMAKHHAADRIGAGEDNVRFRQDQMLRAQESYRDSETLLNLAEHGTMPTRATRSYTDENGYTVAAGDYVDSRGNALTYTTTVTGPGGRTTTVYHTATSMADLARVRDQRRDTFEAAQRGYEKIDKANKALDFQENEYQKVMDTRRHNRHIARRNNQRRAAGGTNFENRQTRAGNMYDSNGGERLNR